MTIIERLEKRLAEERAKENAKAIIQANIKESIKAIFANLTELYLNANNDTKPMIRRLCKSIAKDIPEIANTIGKDNYDNLFKDFNGTVKLIHGIYESQAKENVNND